MPRWTPCIRTYRAYVGANESLSWPPSPSVTTAESVQFTASGEVWILYPLPYADSQLRTTRETGCTEPRSTVIDWSSLQSLAHRVEALPSIAFDAGEL